MAINYNISKMDLGSNMELPREEVVGYIEGKLEDSLSNFNTGRDAKGQVTLKTEGADGRRVQKVEISIDVLGHTIRQEAHSRSMKRAINKACEQFDRQVRKLKTKTIDKSRSDSLAAKHRRPSGKSAKDVSLDPEAA